MQHEGFEESVGGPAGSKGWAPLSRRAYAAQSSVGSKTGGPAADVCAEGAYSFVARPRNVADRVWVLSRQCGETLEMVGVFCTRAQAEDERQRLESRGRRGEFRIRGTRFHRPG